MKIHNFNPGPAILPQVAIEQTAQAVLNFNNSGMSILEISHRSKEFEDVINEAVQLFRELLDLPNDYKVIFVGGGASTQFAMVPMNFLRTKAAYLDTGVWASRAIKESKGFGETIVVASSKDKNYSYIPKNFTIPDDADYFHITTNNTIYGTQLRKNIDSNVPLIADVSSDFLSWQIDITKYSLVYGGAQKNVGPAGVTFVILKESMLDKIVTDLRHIPTMLNYRTHVENNSLYNTPPVLPIFTLKETLKWLKNIGGLKTIEEINRQKATMLYDAIDNSKIFVGTVEKEDRSWMNVCFVMKPEYIEKENDFIQFVKSRGIVGIKGHRSVGGFRASLYNALPIESVKYLIECMKEFERKL